MEKEIKSYMDLVQECDGFPCSDQEPEHTQTKCKLYRFCLKKEWNDSDSGFIPVGYMLPSTIARMPWTKKFAVNHASMTVSIPFMQGENVETIAIQEQLDEARRAHSFEILRSWREEMYRVLGLDRMVLMARGGSALFGIHTIGIHLMAYSKSATGEIKIWIPRRAAAKKTFPGMLDNTAGGGIPAGEDQFERVIHQAEKEASLPQEKVRKLAKSVGTVSYFYVRDSRAGGETGLMQPATQYLFDIELPADVIPQPSVDEVSEFYLWSIDQTIGALKEGQFKPNSAIAWLDFLIRHGYITARNEPQYLELVSRIHRRICF